MKGMDLSRAYYHQIIRPLIVDRFPEIAATHAAALIGWGSDVLGNDDEYSRDHEWGPRCILLLPDALIEHAADLWRELNSEIPADFLGYHTRFVPDEGLVRRPSDNAGDVHIEITTCSKYFRRSIGTVKPESDLQWLTIPEHKLLEVTSGEVFYDGTGELTSLRDFYKAYYPLDVWKYRLAYAWMSLAYDVDLIGLCDARGDILSARHCLNESIFRIIKLTHLLNRVYSHAYPKWLGKQFYKLPHLSPEIGPVLESCHIDPDLTSVRAKLEEVCRRLIDYQNGIGTLPKAEPGQSKYSRGFWNIDLGRIACELHASVNGSLFETDLYGAVDQWVTNQDVMLGNQIGRLSGVYEGHLGALTCIEHED